MNENTKITKLKSISFEFFPSDWMTEPGLRMCSLEARGLWIDLLCLMYLSEKKGFLMIGNEILNEENLKKIFGISKKKIQFLMTELLKYNLIKIDEGGTYFCKRMVDNERIKQVRSMAGQIGVKQKTQRVQRVLLEQKSKQNSSNGENLLDNLPQQTELFNLKKDNFKNNDKDIIIIDSYSNNHTDIITNTNNNIYIENTEKEKKSQKLLLEHPLQIFVKENHPQVSKLKTQLSVEECEKLLAKFSKEDIREVLMRMENFKQLPSKYVSVYLTLNNWLNRKSNESTSNNNDNRRQDFENAIRNF